MTNAMRWVLAGLAMVAAPMAGAQQTAMHLATSVHGMVLQVAEASLASAAPAQVKDDLFAGTEKFAKGATEVTEINLDPKMLGLIPGAKDNSGLAHKMKFVVIHTYEYDKPGMYRAEDVEVYRKKLSDGSWICGVHVRDKSGTTDICSRQSVDREGTEMVILTAEPKELTFIHLSGSISLDDLSRMGESVGGLKHR